MTPGSSFRLSEEQQMLADSARRFLAQNCDFAARTRRLAEGAGVDAALWRQFAQMGWLGLETPEAYGGLGLGAIDTMLLMRELGRELVTERYLASVVLGAGIVREAGTAGQQAALLPRAAAGDLRLAFAFAEPRARYDFADVRTSAVAHAKSGGWQLKGRKCVVLGAPVAGLLIVSARTAGAQREREGLSLFLVPADAPGMALRPYRNVDGHAAAELSLDGVAVAADALLGTRDMAFGPIERTLDRACAAVAAEAAGAMERCVEITREYIATRSQYDQALSSFQVLRHRLVDMYIAMEEATSLAHWAAASLDGGDAQARVRAVASAKVHAGECGRVVGQGAVQLHGGMGIIEEYPIGHYLKRLTAIDRLFGDRTHHLDRYAALPA